MPESAINLWEEIGNKCLLLADRLLNSAQDRASAERNLVLATRLIESAVAIDDLNLRWWIHQNGKSQFYRFGPKGFSLGQQEEEN